MIPVSISYTNFTPSDALSTEIQDRAEKLQHHFNNIQSCKVVVSSPHKRNKSKFFRVQIQVHVPGKTLVVGHSPQEDETHFNPYLTVRDAFIAMTRKLDDFAQIIRHNIKHHSLDHTAPIVRTS